MVQLKQAEAGYAILIEPLSASDGGGWLATVPALPGCTGDGETPEAALADAEGAIAEWIDAARQLGRDVPRPAGGGAVAAKGAALAPRKLKIIAAREGVSLNAYVANVLAEAVGRAA